MRGWRVILGTCLYALSGAAPPVFAAPINVILFIGDGMGFEAVEAGRYFANGDTAPFSFETFSFQGQMTHNNAVDATTDSAASATAMATGQKVNDGVISQAIPGDGGDLLTALELLGQQGRSTGLVTIDTSITDATPAAFGAHEPSRSNHTEIAEDYLERSRPNVLFGGSHPTVVSGAAAAGYTLVTSSAGLAALDADAQTHVAGMFSSGDQPSLAAMTAAALDVLDNNPAGFFLMVEHEGTDNSGHANNIAGVTQAVVDLNEAVEAAIDWGTVNGTLNDTLIIVTADHETGGLNTIANNGAGNQPTVTWSTGGHTQTPVPVYARGPAADASRVQGEIDNTDIFLILTSQTPAAPDPNLVTTTFQQNVGGYAGTLDTFLQQSNSTADNGAAAVLNVDGDDPSGSGQDVQALLRFDDIFGSGPGRIPLDATIVSANLELEVTNPGSALELHRMLVDWDELDTWSSLAGGISADDIEAASAIDSITGSISTGAVGINVTASLAAWLADPSADFGWAILPTGGDGVDFFSSEGTTPPRLVVTFLPLSPVPEPSSIVLTTCLLWFIRRKHFRRRTATNFKNRRAGTPVA